jgi:polar amino acid transport system substrate-binding protein
MEEDDANVEQFGKTNGGDLSPEDGGEIAPELGQDPESPEQSDASGNRNRGSVILAIIAVVIFLIIAAAFVVFLLRNRPELETTTEATTTTESLPIEDSVWGEIQARETIIVGTAANYPPFEYYDQNFEIGGLDIAIIQEIGRRLGLDVELRDMAFDGLGNALQVNQIDLAISAISVTSERAQFVDFSNVYYVSSDALLADDESSIDRLSTIEEVSGLRIGVESGTVYENWARTNLVEAGILPASHVHEYKRIDDAIGDLAEGRIDLVALDMQPAQLAEEQGDVKVVAEGITPQQFAMAVPKGARTLLAEINQALFEMQNDGTLRSLIMEYIGLPDEAIPPLPEPIATPLPPLSPPTTGCIDSSEFVEDLSFSHQDFEDIPQVNAGEAFLKGWRLRNSGTCNWNQNYALIPVDGNDPAARMGGVPIIVETEVQPGQTYDFWVDLVAPVEPGTYVQYWSMRNNPSGLIFGERVSVAVDVASLPTPTPLPTQTPVPGIDFSANPEVIQQGQCSTVTWSTRNVQAVYFYERGENWQVNGVPGNFSLPVCPGSTTTYELRVVLNDGSVVIRELTIFVIPNTSVPQIVRFTVDPPDQISLGQCVTIQWIVEGQTDTVNILRNNVVIWPVAPASSSMQDCPTSIGQQIYSIEAIGPAGTSRAQWYINVVDPATAVPTSTPTVIPGTPTPNYEPVIYYFTVSPQQVRVNQCITLSWSVGGNASKVSLLKNSVTVQENLAFNSSWNDCNNSAIGTVIYILLASSDYNQTTTRQQTVNVLP